MKNTAGISFHNRFDIEVRDAKTGELKQKGEAENIVLDQIYSRLCNFNTYFVNIHFGKGTGISTPGRTSLFSHLGTKTAITSEIIKAYPTSKWTRYIRLESSEYVGSTITEVGIAYGSTNSNLVTHALIKDSEGNPLTIVKSDLDVIVIYATVYITLTNSEYLCFSNMPAGNFILNKLFDEGSDTATLQVGSSTAALSADRNSNECLSFFYDMNVVADVANKKRVWTKRLEVTQSNRAIQEIGLQYGMRALLGNTSIWGDYLVSDIQLTRIEGETNKFAILHPRPQDLQIKVNGAATTNYLTNQHTLDYPGLSMAVACENLAVSGIHDVEVSSLSSEVYQCTSRFYFALGSHYSTSPGIVTMDVKEEFREVLVGSVIEARIKGGSSSTTTIYFEVSYDGQTFISLGSVAASGEDKVAVSALITEPPMKFRIKGHGSNYSSGDLLWMRLKPRPPAIIEVLDEVTESTSVTATYRVTCIPKSENYVLDVTFEVQYGEGV